jgi:hypothetical protein
MIASVLAEESGRRARFGESVAALLRALPALLVVGVLTGLGVEIGATLLIVPGIIVWLLWAVAPSAAAAERDGIFMALGRSQELSEGARWKVFAVLLLLEGANLAMGIAAILLAAGALGISMRPQFSPGYVGVMGIVNTLSCLIWATVQASLYVELVQSKEGGSTESLAEVFA